MEELSSFTRWALGALRCEVEEQDDGIWRAVLPEALQSAWQGEAVLRFRAAANGSHEQIADKTSGGRLLNTDASSPLFRWTIDQLRAQGPVAHAAPLGQPVSVHEISSALFAMYDFPAGHIRLAGCSLEDRPILRVTQLLERGADERLAHHFFTPDGEPVCADVIAQLHLADVGPCTVKPPQEDPEATQQGIDTAQSRLGIKSEQVVAVTLIWCKFAIGKLAFEAGDTQESLPFAGWAAALASGDAKPPAFQCPHSGAHTFELDVTDDGRIAAAEAIAACGVSGERVLRSQLETCAATGKQVMAKHLDHCGVSDDRILASALIVCSQCNQRVSPNVVKGGRCSACRSLAAVRKDDPRMARLLDEYPKLDRWPRWRISETQRMYVLLAASWLRQLLLVVEKDSLAVAHVATSGRLLTNWSELPSAERETLLG